MPVFEIVRQLRAKKTSRAQYLCGFPEGTVEMISARLRALTQLSTSNAFFFSLSVEMISARLRALTRIS